MSFEKQVNLHINGQDFSFNVNSVAYGEYVSAMTANNAVQPSYRFLTRCVVPEQKPALVALMPDPAFSLEIAGAVVLAYKPKFDIDVKP